MADRLKIIPLGGFNMMGMNMTVFEYGESIIVVDCGISFPQNNNLGIDTTIPDITYLLENKDKVKGIVVTHGHEDHIGAIPYILPRLGGSVYGTPLTIALIENKLERAGLKKTVKTKVIRQGNTITLGDFKIEMIRTNHSIPDAVMLAISSPAGTVLHTGDFKIDYTPRLGDPIDLQRLGMLGYKGILAVLPDSTNALRKGTSSSEAMVYEKLDDLFDLHSKGRILISTFSSNMDRVQQIIELAVKYNRKVILEGTNIREIFDAADKLGYLSFPKDVIIDISEISKYRDNELVFITTGRHGDSLSCLTEIAEGVHPQIKISSTDAVIFSSVQINGYEKNFIRTVNLLEEQGATVVYQEAHATGHACAEELKLIYSLLKPKYVIPAHGDFRQRKAAADIAETTIAYPDNILLLKDGDVLELSEESAEITGHVKVGEIIVDGLGVGDTGQRVISERNQLTENGVIVIDVCFDATSGRMLQNPHIVSRGFIEKEKRKEIMDEIYDIVMKCISASVGNIGDETELKKSIKSEVSRKVWEIMRKKPIIITVINLLKN